MIKNPSFHIDMRQGPLSTAINQRRVHLAILRAQRDAEEPEMLSHARFEAYRTVASRLQFGDGDVVRAKTTAAQQLVALGVNPGTAVEIAQDALRRLAGKGVNHHYERLLATHDWTYAFSDDSVSYQRGHCERSILERIASQLDPTRRVWKEYARCD